MVGSRSCERSLHWFATLLLLSSLLMIAAVPKSATAQTDLRYIPETGHYVRGAFRSYWERNGGVSVFGYPLTEEYFRSDGRIVQWFERARFELASSNPVVVELGRIGIETTGDRIFPQVPPFTTSKDRRYIPQTGHSIKGLFRRTWETRGAERIFGYPISEEISEQINGQWTLVQWYERARLELRLYPSRAEFGQIARPLVPVQLLDSWPPEISPPGPLNEDGTPRPPVGFRPGTPRATIRLQFEGGKDTTYRIDGEGFRPGERVRFLLDSPEQRVSSLDPQPLADVNGSISYAGVRFGARDFSNGRWFVTAQGQTSGRAAIGVLQIGGGGQPGPQPGTGGPGVRLSPGSGTFGQAFLVQGEGFQSGEKIALWLTAPDQSVRGIDDQPEADKNGSITGQNVKITADNTFRTGVWFLTAQGRVSGRTAVGQFRIDASGTPQPRPQPGGPPSPIPPGRGDPAKLGQLIQDGLRPNGNGSIVPLAAPPEIPFTFNARGFATNERIGVWLTRPDSGVDPIDFRNDGVGGVAATFKVTRAAEGVWYVTAQGATTGRTVIIPFKVTRDFIASPATPRPATRNGSITPVEGGQRTRFQLKASGFRANERLEFWITSPDGIYYLSAPVTADSRGRLGISPNLIVQLGSQNSAGVYGYHYRGTASGVRSDIYFTFTGAP
ncbi:MAG: hypothetical protein SH847_27255 [Roseiflexaceae bacterium]|nr:hypothetical protein [Roseiflexaceae bacterium]